jgi:RluA family pseudouridine synthase
VDPALCESDHAVCFACLAPLDATDQEDPRYVRGKSCPHCFKSEPELLAERIAARDNKIREACHPLPGSVPLENRRPVNISAAHDKWRLIDVLVDSFPHIAKEEWEARCDAGRFTSYGGTIRGRDHVVRAGERVLQIFPPEVEPPVATDIRVLYEDEALLVVNKPAPLPMHPCGRYHRNTLQNFLNSACAPFPPRPVHRLDANTTGIVLYARTRHFCRLLQRQFLEGTVEKRYLVRVAGYPEKDEFSCDAPISDDLGVLGTRGVDQDAGQMAHTDFHVIERSADGTCLLEALISTGRTNQIRIHLWHLGHPVVGDAAYLGGGLLGDTQTLEMNAPPMNLHAWKLCFRHPRTGEPMLIESERPVWAQGD